MESPVIQQYLNRNATGDPKQNWIAHSVSRRLKGNAAPRVLSLGCGGGVFERDLLGLIPQARVVGLDFSAGAIGLAKQRAAEAGLSIEYRVGDLNVIELERDSFDVVLASGALHHIHELERLLLQIRDCLSTNGFLIASEYVGPNQLQWTDAQVRAINNILELLPSRYKRRISASTEFKLSFLGPSSIEEMNRTDPTEAVHSKGLSRPPCQKYFPHGRFKPIGGTILHMMLQDIIGNFQPGNDSDDCILRLICQLEWNLISSGQLGSSSPTLSPVLLPIASSTRINLGQSFLVRLEAQRQLILKQSAAESATGLCGPREPDGEESAGNLAWHKG